MLLVKIKPLVGVLQTQNESNCRDFESLCFLLATCTPHFAAYHAFFFFF